MIDAEFLLNTFALLTMLGQCAFVVLLLALILRRAQKKENLVTKVVGTHAFVLSFFVALAATVGSLSFSEIGGLLPCKLCWYQRIAMYPMVIIFGVSLWHRGSREQSRYSGIALSFVGALLSGYHYLIQLGITPSVFCTTAPGDVPCGLAPALLYGYITIPLMALTSFVLILTVLLCFYPKVRSEVGIATAQQGLVAD